jgi:uncharacterized protein YjbJ (UPF0337 family)
MRPPGDGGPNGTLTQVMARHTLRSLCSYSGGERMNKHTLEGQWTQLKGRIRKQWGKLTDDDLDMAQGDAEILVGRIQERYGRSKEEAQREFDRFFEQQESA